MSPTWVAQDIIVYLVRIF